MHEGASDEELSRWLIELQRAGELSREGIALAAWLGHAASRLALGGDAPDPPRELESWVRGLARWGDEATVRAALQAARCVVPLWTERHPDARAPRVALRATERWLEEPTPGREEDARAMAEECHGLLLELEATLPPGPGLERELALAFRETRAAVQAALCAAGHGARATRAVLAAVAARERLALEEVPHGVQGIFSRAVQDAHGAALASRAFDADRLGQLPELNTQRSSDAVRAAIAADLIPWALGFRLP